VQDYLTTAHDSAQALLFLLKDLLDFSRTEAGTFELERAPFALRSTIRHATRTLAIRAHEKGLELLCRIGRDVPDDLEGDGRRVQQIIMNLVGNAIKFTDSGEIVVDVTLKSQQADTVELLISVSDTGIGISKTDQERIFLPFTQVDSTSTRKYSGTGLGLTITRELAKRMDGRLWVESTLGRGSRFFCTLNLKPAPGASAETIESTKSLAKLAGQPVLIVDDNESSRSIVAEIVRGWSMRPTVCANGESALDILRNADADRFRITIVDASMPGMDGYSFLETARRHKLLHGAAIIMQSSGGRQVFDERQGELGIAALVEKPVGQFDLLNACVTALEGAKERGERRRQITPTSTPLRVLVAEDTPANQKVVSAILGKRGHVVHVVENGREAVEQVQKGVFDVVLMDAQMPTMNGLQAAAAIRHIPNADRARVPIIAMTAHAMREDRDKCLAAGMNDYLPKPIDAAELIAMVEKHGRKQSPEERPASETTATLKAPAAPRVTTSMVERFGGDRAVAQQFLQVFREESIKQADIINESLDHADPITAARAAHNLRGVAMYLDASALAAAAGALEEALAAGDQPSLKACRQQVQTELASLLKMLTTDKPKSA
jgi:CheY-like chemotaxis protein/anti-sigma regulatory factor (Ser/Thr protein kinase)